MNEDRTPAAEGAADEGATAGPDGGADARPTGDAEMADRPAAGALEDGAAAGLEAELEELRRELTGLNDRHLRLAAEFDNYRKRTDRERRDLATRSQAELVTALLDVVDDMERVGATDPESMSVESLLEGFRLVERKLDRALSAAGLERIEAEGERFDPETMEALMTVPAEHESEEDEVADVLQPGYRFGDHLLRPARVRVKKLDG